MSRTTNDYTITTRTARAALATGKNARTGTANKPYWRTITGPIAIGWQAPTEPAIAGRWYARKSFGGSQYSTQLIGLADDIAAADGVQVLSFEQASIAALAKFPVDRVIVEGDTTIRDAIEAYLNDPVDGYEGDFAAQMRGSAEIKIYTSIRLNKGHMRVRDLTRAQLNDWRKGLLADLIANKRALLARTGKVQTEGEIQRKAKDTANKTLTLLNAALNHAFRQPANGLKSDTEWRIALAKYGKVSRARKDNFTQAQMQQLIASCPNRNFAVLLTAAFLTGARYGELANFIVSDFDAAAGLLTVRESKTDKGRFIPLSDDTVKFIAGQCRDKLPNAPIFTQRSGKPWGSQTQKPLMKAALRAAGLPESATFYAARHSHVSRALEANLNPQEIAENCGTSVRMIAENYSHIDAAKKRANANRLGLRINIAPRLAVVA